MLDNNQRAITYMQQGKWQQALDIFTTQLNKDKTNLEALVNSAIILSKNKHIAEAEKLLQQAIVYHPHSSLALATLAHIYYEQQQYQTAIKLYQQAISLDKQDANNYYMLGKSMVALQQPKLALAYLQSAHDLSPKDDDITMALSLCLCQLKLYQVAVPLLQHLIKTDYQVDATYNLALIYHYQGDNISACRLLQAVLDKKPQHLLAQQALLTLTL